MADNDDLPSVDSSCLACKRLKRKCSREHPQCSLCRRTDRTCRYPDRHGSGEDPVTTSLRARIRELEDELLQRQTQQMQKSPPSLLTDSGSTPAMQIGLSSRSGQSERQNMQGLAMLFLDSVACRNNEAHIQQFTDVSRLHELATPFTRAEVEQVLQRHFDTNHVWLPIISAIRLKKVLSSTLSAKPADFNLLLMALHVLNQCNGRDDLEMYFLVKDQLEKCSDNGILTLSLLATAVIIAAFEVGHGIYPAAYMTVSKCARLSYLLGVHDSRRAVQVLPNPNTWTEREERRRLWWATICLDRCVSVGFRFRPLNIPFLPSEEMLPANDIAWDDGEPAVNPLLVMSTNSNYVVAPYGKMCQAAHLLGRVIHHINYQDGVNEADSELYQIEGMQLHRAISAFMLDLNQEYYQSTARGRLKLCTAKAFGYSASLNLYDTHCCIEGDTIQIVDDSRGTRVEIQNIALAELRRVAVEVVDFADEITILVATEGLRAVSPLICECLYQAAAYFAWKYRENGDNVCLDTLNELRQTLVLLDAKWHVAGLYIKLLERTEYEWTGGCRF